MPYNQQLADRVRELIAEKEDRVEEKGMFGGLSFMVNDKICVAVKSDRILVRIDPAKHEKESAKDGCSPMVHSGREMKGFIFVDEELLHTKKQLRYWVDQALAFNPKAGLSKSSAPKKRK